MTLPEFSPETQIAFAIRVHQIEKDQLGTALGETVARLNILQLDRELAALVPNDRLAELASQGLRGETFFPTALVLRTNPRLLAYYRLLYGISQKVFYGGAMAKFKTMEEKGTMSPKASSEIDELCRNLCETAWLLVTNLPDVSLAGVRDLQLLTLGAQLRGGRLNEIGQAATLMVFQRIRAAVDDSAVMDETPNLIVLTNAAGREVRVTFSSDPDIAVTEQLPTSVSHKLAIEIKGGTDVSNVHNRLGEAEKSHQKAKAKEFIEFWTIVNAQVSPSVAAQESPTTNQFFELSRIIDPSDPEWTKFRDEFTSRLGIPASV